MELLLNAIWLVVATSLFLVWRVRWLPQLRACAVDRRKWQSLIGLSCVLALLFPAISMTDDLHPAEFTLADTKSLYVVAHGHDPASPAPRAHSPAHGFAGVLRISQFRPALLPADSTVIPAQVFSPLESGYGRVSARAPPCLS
jgi:hypothetical protein